MIHFGRYGKKENSGQRRDEKRVVATTHGHWHGVQKKNKTREMKNRLSSPHGKNTVDRGGVEDAGVLYF